MYNDDGRKTILQFLKSIRLSDVNVAYCKRIDQNSKKWILTPHSHPYLELIYFLKGRASVNINDETVNATIFDAIMYLPDRVHTETVDLTKDQEIICFWLDIDYLAPESLSSVKLCDRHGVLRWLFEQIYLEYISKGAMRGPLMNQYGQAIILQCIKYFSVNEFGSELDALNSIQNYIAQNQSAEISPAHLAAMCNVSVSYLHRMFKKHLHTTPANYVNQMRMSTAQKLLTSTDHSVKEVAELAGFEDPAYFCRVFKKCTGQSPTAFRRG